MFKYYSTTIETRNIHFFHRNIIAIGLKNGDSITTIAKDLGFSRQTIHKEIAGIII